MKLCVAMELESYIPRSLSQGVKTDLKNVIEAMFRNLDEISKGEALWIVHKIGQDFPNFAEFVPIINSISFVDAKEYHAYNGIKMYIGIVMADQFPKDSDEVFNCLINALFGHCLTIATKN